MADDDVLEQARAAGLTLATGVSRLGDTFIRAAQQRAEADARDKQRRAANPEWMRRVDKTEALSVWEAAQLWADLDHERFRTAADNVTTAYREAYGTDPAADVKELRGHQPSPSHVDYDSPDARAQRAGALVDAGWPPEAIHARTLADQLNCHDPAGASVTSDRTATVEPQPGRVVHQQHQQTQAHER